MVDHRKSWKATIKNCKLIMAVSRVSIKKSEVSWTKENVNLFNFDLSSILKS